MRLSSTRTAVTLFLALTVAAGCGRSDTHEAGADTAAASGSAASTDSAARAAAAAPSGSASSDESSAPVSVADIDRWQRGMAAELQAVKEARARLDSAKTSDDSLNAIAGAMEANTRAAGAHAAGLDEERYQFVSTTLSDAVANLAPVDQVMHTADMPKQMVEQLQKGREARIAQMSNVLPPEVVDSLRPRAAALNAQSLALAAARVKAAGGQVGGN